MSKATQKRVEEVLERADFAISDLSGSGGYLNPEQSDTFIREIQETPTILQLATVVPMASHTRKFDAIGFDTRIMKAAPQAGGQNDDGSNDRHLTEAQRSKPTTRQVELVAKEVMAEVDLHYETLEDNIERGGMEDTIMSLIIQKVAEDSEDWAINADTASGDPFLALTDGLIKRATSNVVDNLSAGISPNVFKDAQLALPQRYLNNRANMRNFVTFADEINYRSNVAARATGYGDSALQTNTPLMGFGVPITPAMKMPASTALFTYPENIVFGIYRQIMVETFRDIRARTLVVVVSMRMDVNYLDEAAVVKVINM